MKTNKKGNKNSNLKWTITVLILTFLLSLLFSYISTEPISRLNLLPATIILIVVILTGVFFDIVGVAVTVAGEDSFHAKATKKIGGAKTCNDVIGDICGVLSGSIAALISVKITTFYELSFNIQFLIGAIVASLTVGGKAVGKNIAIKNCEIIVDKVSKILNIFSKKEKKDQK